MPPWHHFKTVCWHLRIADRLGFKAVILLTGHYGVNYLDLKTLVELVQPFVGARLYALADFEADIRAELMRHSPSGRFWDWPGDTEILLASK